MPKARVRACGNNFETDGDSARSLDPALLRRFDRRICVDLPNREERELFLKRRMESNAAIRVSQEQAENIAMRSAGMSLAALDSVVELALRNAIKSENLLVDDAILEEAFESYCSGAEKSGTQTSRTHRTARGGPRARLPFHGRKARLSHHRRARQPRRLYAICGQRRQGTVHQRGIAGQDPHLSRRARGGGRVLRRGGRPFHGRKRRSAFGNRACGQADRKLRHGRGIRPRRV